MEHIDEGLHKSRMTKSCYRIEDVDTAYVEGISAVKRLAGIAPLVPCVIDLAPRLCSDSYHGQDESDGYRT